MISLRLRIWVLLMGLLLGLAGWFGLWLLFAFFKPVQEFNLRIEGAIYDLMFRAKLQLALEPYEKLIVIDVEDLEQEKPRDYYAWLIAKLDSAGVKTIGLDLRFTKPRDSLSDDHLVQTAREHAEKLVFAYRFADEAEERNKTALAQHDIKKTLYSIPPSQQSPADALNDMLLNCRDMETHVELPFSPLLTDTSRFGLGHATYKLDRHDRVVRRFPMLVKYQSGFYAALAMEMVRRYQNATYAISEDDGNFFLKSASGLLEIPLDDEGELAIDFLPYMDLKQYANINLQEHFGEDFHDAIVLIVNSKPEDEWTSATPMGGRYPKWAIHASLISQFLEKAFIRDNFGDTFLCNMVFIFLGMIWLIAVEYRLQWAKSKLLQWAKSKPWLNLLIFNSAFLFFAYLMFCFEIHLSVVAPTLVFSVVYALTKLRFYSTITPLSYLDIELLVGKGQDDVYPVTVTRSPLGVGNGSFKSFLQDDAFREAFIKIKGGKPTERHLSYLGEATSIGKKQGRGATKRDLLEIGNKLFQALFSAQVQRIYDRCAGEAVKEKKRLRLQLRVDADELANLPWELLHDAQLRDGFLALSRQISLTRRCQVANEINSDEFRLPLRILVMISSPHGLPPLKAEKEKREIQKALRGLIWLRDIQIAFTEKATPEELEKYLDRGIQVFHFIGHGDFSSQTREGMLAFETDNDELNWVEADRLAYLLGKSQVRMVILNSCETAEASSVDAFTGVAQKLINVGIPEVIAMQFPIADDTAILFSQKFYAAFIRHNSVDEAMAEARRAIITHAGVDKIDWAIPVLFRSEPESIVTERQAP